MTTDFNLSRYARGSMVLHWLMALLIVAMYALINVADVFERGSEARALSKYWHFCLGLTVFVLVWLRIVLRIIYPVPPIVPVPAPWQNKAAKAGHLLLYVLMVAMPLLGWLVLSAKGRAIPFYGFELPALIGADKPLGRQLMDLHSLGGNVGYFLMGGHAAVALWHHYRMKDNTLLRMLPGRKA